MTPADIPRLEQALEDVFPEADFEIEPCDLGRRLRVVAITGEAESAKRRMFLTPDTLDWRGLSMEEWLHRLTIALRSQP